MKGDEDVGDAEPADDVGNAVDEDVDGVAGVDDAEPSRNKHNNAIKLRTITNIP